MLYIHMKLDLKDKKIVYFLDNNSRQSYSQIAREVGLHKSNIINRVSKLTENGTIKNFYTLIDLFKFGYSYIRFYVTYQYATPEIKNKIIDTLVKSKYTMAVNHVEGKYDLTIYMIVKNFQKFNNFWNTFLDTYRNYISTKVFSMLIGADMYPCTFLLNDINDSKDEIINRRKVKELGDTNTYRADELDIHILKLLSLDARISILDMANKLGVSSLTIKNRISNLMKEGVIKGFRVNIDFSKFGYRYFKVDINLRDRSRINEITKFIIKNPHVRFQDFSLGYVDLEFELYLKSIDQLHEFMEEISIRFPESIKDYSYYTIINQIKYSLFPYLIS